MLMSRLKFVDVARRGEENALMTNQTQAFIINGCLTFQGFDH